MRNFNENHSATAHPKLTDEQLYRLCQKYGSRALHWRRKFIGLLPEVNRREVVLLAEGRSWLKSRGFGSIFEFAARLAGVSEEQVRKVLNLDHKFADKPVLHTALIEGKISANKLIRIASVVTTDNQQFWADQAENLSTRSLETLVRDEKILQRELHVQLVPTQSAVYASVGFKSETAQRLERLRSKGIDLDQLINLLLDQREQNLAEEKEKIAKEMEVSLSSRYIPARVKNILKQEHGDRCSIPGCGKLTSVIHHTRRFGLSANHNPRYLAPLCREHHQIAHSIDRQFLRVKGVACVGG